MGAIAGGAVAMVLGILLIAYLFYLNTQLPEVSQENFDYSLPTTIYDRSGQKVDEIYIKRRKLVIYEQLPEHLINGLIAKEDSRFFDHQGIDPLRMLKAAWVNLLAMRTVQGASTLTQQTARQFFLTLEKTWERKLKEILLAVKMEQEFTKNEIMVLYLNKVNFGDAWGVSAAAEVYFSKKVEDLSLSESSTLVGLLPAPNAYKPTKNPHLSRQQRNIVLQRMFEEGFIPRSQMMASMSEPIVLAEGKDPKIEAAGYYVELVRRKLLELYGSKSLYEGGLHVYTAMDINFQISAHRALVNGVRSVDRRKGYRGPLSTMELLPENKLAEEELYNLNSGRLPEIGKKFKGVVTGFAEDPDAKTNPQKDPETGDIISTKRALVALGPDLEGYLFEQELMADWKVYLDMEEEEPEPKPFKKLEEIIKAGDLIQVELTGVDALTGAYYLSLYQEPLANGALYSMDPTTGEVMAMVGGVRFGRGDGASEFIRATQAERQPGSSFKPLIYAAAIEEGFTPATLLEDSPRTFLLSTGKKHTPANYDKRYLGRISLRESLMRSRNVPTVQLVDEIGARKVIEYSRRFGITTNMPEESIIALGTHSVKLSELTRAYGVFANSGKLVTPRYIRKILDSKGEVIYESPVVEEVAISEGTAFLVGDILRDVVRRPGGTAYRPMEGFTRPAGGKTGTTQNYTDAWYIGFIPQLVTGIYVGFDDPSIPLGPYETGGGTAAPVWKEYMTQVEGAMSVETFNQPDSVMSMRVTKGGEMVGPCDNISNSRFEWFKTATIPSRLRSQGSQCFTPVGGGPVTPSPASGGGTQPESEEL